MRADERVVGCVLSVDQSSDKLGPVAHGVLENSERREDRKEKNQRRGMPREREKRTNGEMVPSGFRMKKWSMVGSKGRSEGKSSFSMTS